MEGKEKRGKYGKSLFLLVFLTAVTILVLLRGYKLSDLAEALAVADSGWLTAGFFCMFLFVTCEAVNIRTIMKGLGKGLSLCHCEQYAFVGFYFSSITPSSSGGQPMQVYCMKKDGISVGDSSAVISYVVFVYQLAMILFAGLAAVFHPAAAGKTAGSLKYLLVYGSLANGTAAVILAFVMLSEKTVKKLAGAFICLGTALHLVKNEESIRKKVNTVIEEYHDSAVMMKKNPILFLKVLSVTLVQMGALASVPYCVYRALGYTAMPWGFVVTVQSFLTLASSAVPLPGSVGAAEGGFLWAFRSVFPAESVRTAMIVSRGISFYLFLIISFVICIFKFRGSGSRRKVDGKAGMG